MAGTCAHVEFLRAQPWWALALAAVGLLVAARAALHLALWVYAAFLRPGKPLRRRYGPWAVVTGSTDSIGRAIAFRRAMTHASYSRDNGRALAVLGLAASQSAAALTALAADRDASHSAVSRATREAAGEAACAAAGARAGIPSIVRVAGGTKASAAPVVCGALRALVGAVAVDSGTADAAGEMFWRLQVLSAARPLATAAM